MKELLHELLPRIFPDLIFEQHFLCIKHEGKTDLDKSISKKIPAWRFPNDRFIIIRDNDGADCRQVKKELLQKCKKANRVDTKICLVCQELESWYLGDLSALEETFGCSVNTSKNKKRFRKPDDLLKPSDEVKRLIPSFQKRSGARHIGKHLCLIPSENLSHSFQIFLHGVRKIAKEMGYQNGH